MCPVGVVGVSAQCGGVGVPRGRRVRARLVYVTRRGVSVFPWAADAPRILTRIRSLTPLRFPQRFVSFTPTRFIVCFHL